MALMLVLFFLAAALPPSLLQDNSQDNSFEKLSTTKTSVQEEIVSKHNQLRRMVSPSGSDLLKMEWSHEAQVNAQQWADKCTYSHSPIELRTTNLKCGENLFMSSYLATWSSAIQVWYDEYKDLTFSVGPKQPGSMVGHYTQVVWNSTFQVACGVAECPENPLRFFYVCHYCPGGNYLGRIYTPYTAGEPCASCPDYCEDGLCTNSCGHEDNYSNCEDLKKTLPCEHPLLKEGCKATCLCEGKIH
ncbi:cysteine-rich secretory protein 1 isoform X2 [Mus pahari]|uniref:cysteine-rich secretory protein 1 isoform X1 n=1 Tax=Mus pahari TaxID=10093 RepID=UPI000A312F17|nr:cysteine-rich secretory protein 1 isoform X1 [Mus pahari]XP_021074065.1 cysteine-rich secretory protein 1 isoform X2 [Mus pahari]